MYFLTHFYMLLTFCWSKAPHYIQIYFILCRQVKENSGRTSLTNVHPEVWGLVNLQHDLLLAVAVPYYRATQFLYHSVFSRLQLALNYWDTAWVPYTAERSLSIMASADFVQLWLWPCALMWKTLTDIHWLILKCNESSPSSLVHWNCDNQPVSRSEGSR